MARYQNGINGPVRGKIGVVVGATWKGQSYLRSLPRPSNKPPTEKKKAAINAFKFINDWLNPISRLVMIGFENVNPRCTGRNSAHSYNAKHALLRKESGLEMDYTKAHFSQGELQGTSRASVEMKDEETLLISWDASITDTGAGPSDGLMYFVYFPDLQIALTDVGSRKRQEGQAAVYIPSHLRRQRLEVQIAFKSLVTNEVSTSQYAGGLDFDKGFERNHFIGEEKPLCKAMSVGESLFKRT